MELRQLEYFIAVCEELHFTRAAENLGIAQSSLSQQISLLEHEMGTLLFDRIGKRIALTDAGRTLLHHAYRIFNELSQAQASILELQGLQRGRLKIGALLTVSNYLLPPSVIAFHKRYPGIELSVLGLRTGDIFTKLLQNELDLGIVYLPMEHPDIETIALRQEQLVLAFAIDHPMSKQASASLEVLAETASILLPNTYFLRQLLNEQCLQYNFKLQPTMELTTMESITTMVRKGAGVTVLPKAYLDFAQDPFVSFVPIHPKLTTQIGIAYRKNKNLCAASKAFINQLIEENK